MRKSILSMFGVGLLLVSASGFADEAVCTAYVSKACSSSVPCVVVHEDTKTGHLKPAVLVVDKPVSELKKGDVVKFHNKSHTVRTVKVVKGRYKITF